MVAHPGNASSGLFILKFLGCWRHTSPNDVIYLCNPQKAPPCAETRRLSYKAWELVQRFDLGACARKKTNQERTVKKSRRGYISPTVLVKQPLWIDLHWSLYSSCRPRCNQVCKIFSWNFQGLMFCRGRVSNIHIDSRMGLTTVHR